MQGGPKQGQVVHGPYGASWHVFLQMGEEGKGHNARQTSALHMLVQVGRLQLWRINKNCSHR
jgi:hypothetical protein